MWEPVLFEGKWVQFFLLEKKGALIMLSSTESELHSIVSGCSDGIYIKRCLDFLTGKEVEHFQWTDNSAARQLVSRQGVGRIRHLESCCGFRIWFCQSSLQGPASHGMELQ